MGSTKRFEYEVRAFAEDVRRGLGGRQKALPSLYFYDALGSQLFETICRLPWYPVTRAETRLLERHARAMVAPFGDAFELCELGGGSGDKLAILAGASSAPTLPVHLVDVSEGALALARATLSRYAHVRFVTTHRATYEEGLRALATRRRAGARLVCFLGSNLGNFHPPAARTLLAAIAAALHPGDGLLLGVDLVRSEAEMILAYDDPLGVTAAFDKNVLRRINDELGGDFDLAAFAHRAVWNAEASRIEMHVVSRRAQRVRVTAAEVEVWFEEGESIWTESSYKYTPEGLVALGREVGLSCQAQWVDGDGRFAETLFALGA